MALALDGPISLTFLLFAAIYCFACAQHLLFYFALLFVCFAGTGRLLCVEPGTFFA